MRIWAAQAAMTSASLSREVAERSVRKVAAWMGEILSSSNSRAKLDAISSAVAGADERGLCSFLRSGVIDV